jgi:hypothetical protein
MATQGFALTRYVLVHWQKMLLGAFSFWLPDVVYHYAKGTELSATAIWEMTAIMPLATLITYAAVLVKIGRQRQGRSVATPMLLGIWVLAPTMIALGTTFAGAGLRSGLPALLVIALGTVLFPIWTPIMAGYDLTIPALILVTISLLAARFGMEKQPAKIQVRA